MGESIVTRRSRGTFRLDGQRLRDERTEPRSPRLRKRLGLPEKTGQKYGKITQAAMAEAAGVGLSAYQKAEKGECVDEAIARRIALKLELDETESGLEPCNAPPEPDTGTYIRLLREECSHIDVRGLVVGSGKAPRLGIADVYIPLRMPGGLGEREGYPEQRVKSLDEALRHRKVVIVGNPGGGKSTYLRRLAWERCGSGEQFPLLIRIFSLEHFIFGRIPSAASTNPDADSPDWIPRYLAGQAATSGWGLDADFFRRKLRDRNTLLLLDGLDEVPNALRRAVIARLFERATGAFRDARFVVTTRPAAYEGTSTLANFETVQIADLDPEDGDRFLESWSGFLFPGDRTGARRHYDLLRKAVRTALPEIRRMASNPLMLTALAVIHWNDKRLPEQRADLYASILKWLSEARDFKSRRTGNECLQLFAALALEMQRYPGGRVKQVEKAEAARLIADKFPEVQPEHRVSAALEFLENERLDSGIIADQGDSLEFRHLTFQEYLAAWACTDFNEPAKELCRDDRWSRPEWREVIRLVCGILIINGTGRVGHIFNEVLDQAEASDNEPSGSLERKARAAGLLGSALQDIRATNPKYRPPDEQRYNALMNEIKAIRDPKRASEIELRVRVEAGEALGQAGDPILAEDNWVLFPAARFLMGAQKTRKNKPNYDAEAFDNETVREGVIDKELQIGRYPVTVEEYKRFLEDEANRGVSAPTDWDEQLLHLNRPVVSVSWNDATAYCAWATTQLPEDCGWTKVQLPSEEQWEFAARGAEARKYPWGNEPADATRANYHEAGVREPTPVGLFPAGSTPEGVADMAGNVWEWTGTEYDKDSKVVRGASFSVGAGRLRAADRLRGGPQSRDSNLGFRCVRE